MRRIKTLTIALIILSGMARPALTNSFTPTPYKIQEQELIAAVSLAKTPFIAAKPSDDEDDWSDDDWDDEDNGFYGDDEEEEDTPVVKKQVTTPVKTTAPVVTVSPAKPTTTSSPAKTTTTTTTTPVKTTTTTTIPTATQTTLAAKSAEDAAKIDADLKAKAQRDLEKTEAQKRTNYVKLANTFDRTPEDFARLYSQYGDLLAGLNPENPKDLKEIEKLIEIVGIPKRERTIKKEATLKQAPSEDPIVNFSARNIATRDAFATLARVSGKSITVSGSVQDRDTISVVEINNQPFTKAFLSLVDAADVDFRRSGDNYTILKKQGGKGTSLIAGFDTSDIDLTLPLEERYADLTYDNEDLSSIIKDLANTYGVDVVMTANPTDRITLKVRGVNIDDAFELLFAGSQFNYTKKGETYVVYSSTNKNFSLDSRTVLFPLKYLEAQEANKLLPAELKNLVQVSSNQNAFIADGSKQQLTQLYDFIRTIDKPIPQVELVVKLVEISKDFTQSHNLYQTPFTIGKIGNVTAAGSGTTAPSTGFNVNLGSKYMGIFANNPTFSQTNNNAQIKVNQRLLVTSGKSAKINFDQDINVVLNKAGAIGTGSIAAQQQSINRVTAGNSMDITPIVGGGGVVTVKVEVEVSVNGTIDPTTGVPQQTVRRRISSEIQIVNHETIAIGGLFDDRKGYTRNNEIPVLSKIPIIGSLFGNNSRNKNLRELLILITPNIRTGDEVEEVYLQAAGATY